MRSSGTSRDVAGRQNRARAAIASQFGRPSEMQDTFEYNPGPKRGALVEARPGRGRWIYVGLGLWRQLPAGTAGAYALLANLLSLGASDR